MQVINLQKLNKSQCYVSKFTWHSRLGHPVDQALNVLKTELNFKSDPLPPCLVCHKAKQTRDTFPIIQHSSKKVEELVHLDVWGPYRVNSVLDSF